MRVGSFVVTTNGAVRIGQRVWVIHGDGRAFGSVASLPESFLGGDTGFVVMLDGAPTAITCDEDRRGCQWDFAADVDAG